MTLTSPFFLVHLVIGSLLLGMGAFFLVLNFYLPTRNSRRQEYLLFGLSSICFALTTLVSFGIYTSRSPAHGLFLFRWLLAFSSLQYVFFFWFSVQHMRLESRFYRRIFPILGLFWIPCFFIDPLGFTGNTFYHTLGWGAQRIPILRAEFGVVSYAFVAWALANLAVVAGLWARHWRRTRRDVFLLAAFWVLFLFAVNDVGVYVGWWHRPYLFEIATGGIWLAMACLLFSDYVQIHRELRRKTIELETLNGEMRFLLNALSHDYTAPLLSIGGFVDALKDRRNVDDLNYRQYLDRISKNADYMRDLMRDLSLYLKMGRVEDVPESFDFIRLAEEVWEVVVARNPEARLELSPENFTLRGTRQRLRQVLTNLFENSIKHAEKSDVVVRLKIVEQGQAYEVVLEDNGPGIPPEFHEKVFEPFFRYDMRSAGSGLGLAIVRRILGNFGGRVWVDATAVSGLRICLSFPKNPSR